MEQRTIASFFFLALLIGTLGIVGLMAWPFLSVLILAAVLAFLFQTPHRRLTARLGNRPSLAAFLLTLVVVATVLVPLTAAGWRIVQEATNLYSYLRSHATPEDVHQITEFIERLIRQFAPSFTLDPNTISETLQNGLSLVLNSLGSLFAGIGRMVIGFFLLLLFFYYLVRDGEKLKRGFMRLSPLSDEHETAILHRIGIAVAATVRGSILIAVLQGFVSGIGFVLFGVPNPALWGGALMLAAFIPTLGTSLIQIPAVIFLLATGQTLQAIGLACWAIVAVGLLDNILGPKLVSGATRLHPLFTMIGVLGGITLFGPIGILLGPIIMSLMFALFTIYLSLVRGPQH